MMLAIQIGTITISTYKLMIGAGSIGMLLYTLHRRKRLGLSTLSCVLFVVLLTLCGVAGARLLYILENLDDLNSALSGNGVSFFGSVYLIPMVMPLIGRILRLKGKATLDLCAPCVAIMVACIRIGCLLGGCCGGWVVYIGDIYFAWPTQIMECIGDFLIFLWLGKLHGQSSREGQLYPFLMIAYSVLRFFIEFLRYSPEKWLIFSAGHGFAVIAILAAILWLAILKQKEPMKQVIT